MDNRTIEYASPPVQQEVKFRTPPLVLDGRLLVDMLEVAEFLDVSLGYHPGSRVITLEGRGRPLKVGVENNVYSGTDIGSHDGPSSATTAGFTCPYASFWSTTVTGLITTPIDERFMLIHEFQPGAKINL